MEQQEQWTANRRFIFSFPRLALRARVALRAKYRVRPAWLIKRLSCRLSRTLLLGNRFQSKVA